MVDTLGANEVVRYGQQVARMIPLALQLNDPCDEEIKSATRDDYFHCWDMASASNGYYVPDGQIDAWDLSVNNLQDPSTRTHATYLLMPEDLSDECYTCCSTTDGSACTCDCQVKLLYRSKDDCASSRRRKRSLVATIDKSHEDVAILSPCRLICPGEPLYKSLQLVLLPHSNLKRRARIATAFQ